MPWRLCSPRVDTRLRLTCLLLLRNHPRCAQLFRPYVVRANDSFTGKDELNLPQERPHPSPTKSSSSSGRVTAGLSMNALMVAIDTVEPGK
jgi:hypothetical protein